MKSSFILDALSFQFEETDGKDSNWVHALPLGTYKHPVYGTIDITADRIKNFADGVKAKVRGIDPSINYNHNNVDVAAGWVKDAEARTDGLWLFVEWVKDAAQAIKDKKWRYFSSEFEDEWTDSTGKKHKDVILGGALTNRPFMKNLVPVNLSEETYNLAFDLISAVTGTDVDSLKGGNMPLSEEDLKKIVEGVSAKLTEGKVTDPAPTKSLADIPELKALAEENPMVATLIKFVETQKIELSSNAQALKLAEINAKLNDFDRTKIVLTPVARKLAGDIMVSLSDDLQEPFWKLLTEMKKGTSFLVELGERGGATVNYGSARSAITEFNDATKKLMESSERLSAGDALERVAAENPNLYARYRQELMEGVTN